MIRILGTFNHIKVYSSTYSKTILLNTFSSSKLIQTTYPYVFGGLKNAPFIQNNIALVTLKEIFDQGTLEGFKQAYKYTLYSMAQKDNESLKNICQPNLLKNINLQSVQLVNPDANVQVVCTGSFKAFGATFIRQSSSQLKLMQSDNNNLFYLNFGLMNPNNPTSVMKYMSSGLPILLAYEVLFRSAMKLVPVGSPKNQKISEIHSIQFQVQGKINVMKYMNIAMSMGNSKPNVDFNQAKSILKEMVGNSFQWKIGDIDRSLKGNVKVIS